MVERGCNEKPSSAFDVHKRALDLCITVSDRETALDEFLNDCLSAVNNFEINLNK